MIPNILTTVRLIIIPFFAYFMLIGENFWISAVLFLLSGVTDVVDGWIARKYNMITDVGSVYDPLVDKLMQITSVVCLSIKGVIPVWIICVVAVKEISMIIVGIVLYIKKIVVHSNWYGKAATVIFYMVISALILFPAIGETLKTTLLAMLVIVLVLTAMGYLVKIAGSNSSELYKRKT
ncbi:MAG: CDP-alcohol phosphatidyltransferase family protein [Clostridia bacterium]|nr:CDP-alcohol phosphatidyltransferase family protein [Clostridia bacterium]